MRTIALLSSVTTAELLDCDIVVTEFSREQVIKGELDHIVESLELLSGNSEVARNLMGSMFLSFGGWESDPREIYDIPEVVQFFRALTERWPYWFYFLEAVQDSAKNSLFLLLDVKLETVDGRQMGYQFDPAQFTRKAMYLFEHMNSFMLDIGLSEEDIAARSREIEQALMS
ncbi:hypothetical protein [Stenotrophomonas maltophilia]|uniref:hypothetical protein n=1 Tax=Stenotrophomonas maltophilia TaxID=40324 RepID=UPI0021C8FEB7|nr:hypothetical protein [Stenotrophomonas maltophilia]MCU1136992.1 hypothetical protein [Stenotrophomonas maltophilia]